MKKVLLIILIIVLIIGTVFGIKKLLDLYSEEEKDDTPTLQDYLDNGWEVEAEYTYNGTITEDELKQIQDETNTIEENNT